MQSANETSQIFQKKDLLAKLLSPVFNYKKAIVVVLLLAAGIGGTVYLAREKPELLGIQIPGINQETEDAEVLIEEVGRLIALPQDEQPTIATVTDVEALNDQTFFQNAQNGDRVLVYTNARKAYLYRPSEKKIIEVGVVNIDQEGETAGVETEVQSEPYTFILLNGSGIVGAASDYQEILLALVQNADVVAIGNTSSADYQQTVLIDLKEDKEEIASQIAEDLEIEVSDLPEEESVLEDVDFVIIIGADQFIGE